MNYGYDSSDPIWKEDRKETLAARLREKFPNVKVEVDGLYDGVRMRRLTHLSEAERDLIVDVADSIYREVMS